MLWARRDDTESPANPGLKHRCFATNCARGASLATLAGRAIARFIAPRLWTVFPAMGLGFVIGSSTDILSGILANTSGNLRGLALTPAAAAIWLVCFIAGSAIRTKRFHAREMPRLRELVDQASQPPPAIVTDRPR